MLDVSNTSCHQSNSHPYSRNSDLTLDEGPWARAQAASAGCRSESEELNQRSSLIWTTARRLKEFLFGNFDVLLIDASSLAEKATFGAPQRVLSPPHAASVVVHVGCIADLVHPCPLACPSLVHRSSTDNATAVPRQANSSRPGVNGLQCSSITACSCRCLLFKHLTRWALVP